MGKIVGKNQQKAVRSVGVVAAVGALVAGLFVGGSPAVATNGYPCIESQFFLDVPPGHKFFDEINMLGCSGTSTGFRVSGGRVFEAKQLVSREAMAAFIYRVGTSDRHLENYPFETPSVSPFADVQPGDKFYREITWLHHKGIATGTRQKNGKPFFQPKASITREAMAAFLSRYFYTEGGRWENNTYDRTPKISPFEDLTPTSRFYKEIADMEAAGVTTGVKTETGREFRPKENVTREAMAAFITRIEPLGNGIQW